MTHMTNPVRWRDLNWPRYIMLLLMSVGLVYLTKRINQTFLPLLETRQGFDIYDPVLEFLPAADMSEEIFVVMYSATFIGFFLLGRHPRSLVIGFMSYMYMYLFRFICICGFPLNAPQELVVLRDPIVDMIELNPTFLRRDLFYSGHFATVFMIFIMVGKKWYRWLFLLAALMVGLLILVQHIHYFYDVLGAGLFSYISVYCATRTVNAMWIGLRIQPALSDEVEAQEAA